MFFRLIQLANLTNSHASTNATNSHTPKTNKQVESDTVT